MNQRVLRRLRPLFLLSLVLLPSVGYATTYVVNTTSDVIATDGNLTLREAMMAASINEPFGDAAAGSPGLDTITFNIPGAGVRTIVLESSLPFVFDPLLIDGWSQPGAVRGVPLIALNGNGVVFRVIEIATPGGGTTIRGLALDGFRSTGISIRQSSGNTVVGNYIGVSPSGTTFTSAADAQNAGVAILAGATTPASGNRVGGLGAGEGNVIATAGPAVALVLGSGVSSGNTVVGNRLNTNAAGTTFLGAENSGSVLISGGTNTVIGGTAGTTPGGACTGSCNLMGAGVSVNGPGGDATTIAGNFFGTDVTGTVALAGTTQAAVFVHPGGGVYAGTLLIGGTSPNARNVILGNSESAAILLNQPGTAIRVTIQGNYIGVDTTGMRALSTAPSGITLSQVTGAVIGGATAAHGNVISGHTASNVQLLSSTGTTIQNNVIGPAADRTSSVNTATINGVTVNGTSTSNVIGAALPGDAGGNVIAYANTGVSVASQAVGTTIFSNSIFATSRLGIDLNGNNVTNNDSCDADTGGNLTQNYPVLGPFVTTLDSVVINGTLNSVANGTYRLQFFASPAGTTRQGRTLIGSMTVSTDAQCTTNFSVTLPLQPIGTAITATATDAAGNTSEISASVAVPASLAIPTLSEISLLMLGLFFAATAVLVIQRS